LLETIQRWIQEPPPDYLFEVTETGLAAVQRRNPASLRVTPFAERAINVSPSEPNITRRDLVEASVPKPVNGNGRGRAALVLPDYATRISVLDFEEMPADEQQRLALVRFRLRKTVPFSVDEAQVSAVVQPASAQRHKIEVLAAAIARPVLADYEDVLRAAGYQVGQVMPSSLAAVSLCTGSPGALTLFAKLSTNVLSILLIEDQQIRLVRCVDLSTEENDRTEQTTIITTLLQQTLAFAEDELVRPVQRLVLCGFGATTEEFGDQFEREFGLSWAPVKSRFAPTTQETAGVLGLLEQYAA
jgi:type IV pilus assembly protein PilM